MRPRPIVKNRGFYKPMQKEERGSLGLNPRAFGLFLIVVEVEVEVEGFNKSRT
jgi:hypothetical protein